MISYPMRAGGISTRVVEHGHGDTTALFVHGVGARADRWVACLRRLPPGVRGVAIDLPGHGFAVKGAGPDYSVPAFAELIADLAAELGIERAVGVGTSLGGHVVATAAVEYPGLFPTLVLVGATGIVPLGEEVRNRIADRLTDATPEGVAEKLRWLVLDGDLVTDEWIEEEYRINNSAGAAVSFTALADYFARRIDDDVVGTQLRRSIEQRGTDVHLIWGQDDRSVPIAVGEAAARELGELPLVRIEHAAHAPYLEQPDTFAAVLKAALA